MEKLKVFIKKYVIFINTAAYIFIYDIRDKIPRGKQFPPFNQVFRI